MSRVIRTETLAGGCQLLLAHGDLTEEAVDAILNAANPELQHGGGVAGAIVRRGGHVIQEESDGWVRAHGPASPTHPALTGAGKLPCRAVSHVVGPLWGEGDEDHKLAEAVASSLALAAAEGFHSLAMPAISTGIFGFPKARGAHVIVQAVLDFLGGAPALSLAEIRITVIDEPTLGVFRSDFDRRWPPAFVAPRPLRESPMITSVSNERVKLIRTLQAQAKARAREKLFVIEGERLLVEAVNVHAPLRMVFHSGGLKPPQRSLLNQAARLGATVEEVSPEVLKACSATTTPPGMLAVVPWVAAPLAAPLDFVLLADGLANPGNLGTVLRTAEAFGVQAVFLMPGCVDAYNPKVVRGAMGAHFRLPLIEATWPEVQARLHGIRLYLAEAEEGTPCDQVSWRGRIGLILGSEAEGAGALARATATARVHIPMPGKAESLNAVVAAGILLYQAARQRRSRS